MLEQVLQQNAGKGQAKSKQRQIQTLARRVLVFGKRVKTSIHSSSSVTRAATASSAKPQPGHDRFGWMAQGFNGGRR